MGMRILREDWRKFSCDLFLETFSTVCWDEVNNTVDVSRKLDIEQIVH